jgi:GntR family transcriptional repressor for pyruvate dehydrogenase complex
LSTLKLTKLAPAPSYKRVADMIEREILNGSLATGDLLPTESELAEQIGVHRSTVREGIRALENAGLIRRVGGKRLEVCVPSENDIARSTTRALGLNRFSFIDLWEVQMNLEPFSAGLAAERASSEILDKLDQNLERTRQNLQDDATIIDADIEFHQLIAAATGNKALILAVKPIGILLFSATRELYRLSPNARARLLDAHERIYTALVNRDTDMARDWMTKHIFDFRRGYEVAKMDVNAPIDFDASALDVR